MRIWAGFCFFWGIIALFGFLNFATLAAENLLAALPAIVLLLAFHNLMLLGRQCISEARYRRRH